LFFGLDGGGQANGIDASESALMAALRSVPVMREAIEAERRSLEQEIQLLGTWVEELRPDDEGQCQPMVCFKSGGVAGTRAPWHCSALGGRDRKLASKLKCDLAQRISGVERKVEQKGNCSTRRFPALPEGPFPHRSGLGRVD
jgi:hypothetical protein